MMLLKLSCTTTLTRFGHIFLIDNLKLLPFGSRFKAWSHRRTDMYRKENGLKYAEFGYPVTKFISSAAQSSCDLYVEPGS